MKGNQIVVDYTPPDTYVFSYVPTGSKKNSVDWLPSVNIKFELQDDLLLRFAASQTVHASDLRTAQSRPPRFRRRPERCSARATRATRTSRRSSRITSTFRWSTISARKARRPAQCSIAPSMGTSRATISRRPIGGIDYNITSVVNAPAGHIDGAEVGYTQSSTSCPAPSAASGRRVNATFVDGNFQNISKWSYNVVGIYEKGPYSLRVAYNWRDGFNVGPAPAGGRQPQTIFAKSQPWLDLSASYQMSDHFTVTLDATNLLDSRYQDYFGNPMFPRDTRPLRPDGVARFALQAVDGGAVA